MMSRFKVGEEITVKEGYGLLEYGKFYPISMISDYWNIIVVENGHRIWVDDTHALTRAEYEQAEREKDPFAPGKWVVCVLDDWPAKVGDVLLCERHIYHPETAFMSKTHPNLGFFKSHFRPTTLEEVKEQKQKVMNETKDDSAATERQTFTVGGNEFYVGQKVWVVEDGLSFSSGTKFEVIGPVYNAPLALCVRKPSSSMTYFVGHALVTTTKPKPHEWKFGDWARHPDFSVAAFVLSGVDADGEVMIGIRDNWTYKPATELTYISSAEIPA